MLPPGVSWFTRWGYSTSWLGAHLQGSIGKDGVVALIGLPGFDIVDLMQVRRAFSGCRDHVFGTVDATHGGVWVSVFKDLIMCLDFVTIFIFTGTLRVAVGFMVVSNLYTTFAYVFHELLWPKTT